MYDEMSHCMRRPKLCIYAKTKMQLSFAVTDQIRGNREADQRLCFPYTDSTIPLLSKSELLSLLALFCLYTSRCVGPSRRARMLVCHTKAHILIRHEFIIHFEDHNS